MGYSDKECPMGLEDLPRSFHLRAKRLIGGSVSYLGQTLGCVDELFVKVYQLSRGPAASISLLRRSEHVLGEHVSELQVPQNHRLLRFELHHFQQTL